MGRSPAKFFFVQGSATYDTDLLHLLQGLLAVEILFLRSDRTCCNIFDCDVCRKHSGVERQQMFYKDGEGLVLNAEKQRQS